MHNLFILKTNNDSTVLSRKLKEFLSKYCNETETEASLFELSGAGKEKAEELIKERG